MRNLIAAVERIDTLQVCGRVAAVNGLLNGAQPKGDMSKGDASFAHLFQHGGAGLKAHVAPGPHAGVVCADSLGNPWKGDYVFNSGNLILDLLHNFFLENGARTAKLRAYQLTTNPAARRMSTS